MPAEEAQIKYSKVEKEYRDYLAKMGAPLDFIDKIMSYKSTDAYFLEAEEILNIVGKMPASLEEWFISKCGELSEDEKEAAEYLQFIRSDKNNLQLKDKTAEEWREFLTYRLELYEQVTANLPEGYKSYLLEKADKFDQCTLVEKAKLQYRAIKEFQWRFLIPNATHGIYDEYFHGSVACQKGIVA